MRTIALIVMHCSANRQDSTLRMMDTDHLYHSLSWKGCGYHFVIPTDSTVEIDKPFGQVSVHCKNHNRYSIGVCYIGGLANDGKTPMDTRAEVQREILQGLFRELHRRFPKALIVGHQDLDPSKFCPCFNVVSKFSDWFSIGSPFTSLECHAW